MDLPNPFRPTLLRRFRETASEKITPPDHPHDGRAQRLSRSPAWLRAPESHDAICAPPSPRKFCARAQTPAPARALQLVAALIFLPSAGLIAHPLRYSCPAVGDSNAPRSTSNNA